MVRKVVFTVLGVLFLVPGCNGVLRYLAAQKNSEATRLYSKALGNLLGMGVLFLILAGVFFFVAFSGKSQKSNS